MSYLRNNTWLTSNHLLYRMYVSFNYTVDELHVMDNVFKTVTQQVTSLSANIVTYLIYSSKLTYH